MWFWTIYFLSGGARVLTFYRFQRLTWICTDSGTLLAIKEVTIPVLIFWVLIVYGSDFDSDFGSADIFLKFRFSI